MVSYMEVSQSQLKQIHERALRFLFENNLSFSELLDLYNSVTVHQKKKKRNFANSYEKNL